LTTAFSGGGTDGASPGSPWSREATSATLQGGTLATTFKISSLPKADPDQKAPEKKLVALRGAVVDFVSFGWSPTTRSEGRSAA
jgi:hypothetical protein